MYIVVVYIAMVKAEHIIANDRNTVTCVMVLKKSLSLFALLCIQTVISRYIYHILLFHWKQIYGWITWLFIEFIEHVLKEPSQ